MLLPNINLRRSIFSKKNGGVPAYSLPIGSSPVFGTIAVTSGTGFAGSTYTANMTSGGQWYADDTAISGATSLTYVMTVANEGKTITYRRSGTISNKIKLWMYPQLGTTLKCWYDAALTTSFTYQSGANISRWANRVSGAVAATQNTTNKYPQYTTNGLQTGYNAVVANGTFQQFTMASGFALNDQTVLAVMKTNDTKATTSSSWWASPGIWGNEIGGFPADFGWGLQAGLPMFGASNTKFTVTSPTVNDNQPMLLGYTRHNTSGELTHYYNAASIGSAITTAGTRVVSSGVTSMFNIVSANNVASGNVAYLGAAISEFIIIDTLLNASERQKVEGCAAWRWGIQSKLPVDHPFKNGPPAVNNP